MKNNKGITLIALIITIIVMLILVAVTVAVVVNSDLIGTAQGAKTKTEAHAVNDQTYGMNVTIKGEPYESVGDYVNSEDGEDDDIVVIDPNGELILHVFGDKFRIGNANTWKDLEDNSKITVSVEYYDYFSTYGYVVNGRTIESALSGILWAQNYYEQYGEYYDGYWHTEGPTMTTDNDSKEDGIASFLGNDAAIISGAWLNEKEFHDIAELKTLSGFEDNSIYIEGRI